MFTNFKYLYDKFDHCFKSNECELVNSKYGNYKEIFNVSYILEYDEQVLDELSDAPSPADEEERKNIILESIDKIGLIEDDESSRQFVIQKKYANGSDLASCIPLLQVIVRYNEIHLFVHVRSQNFYKNWLYDNRTYMLIMKNIIEKLKCEVTPGGIYVKIVSLHSYK